MLTTTRHEPHVTLTLSGGVPARADNELCARYEEIIRRRRLNWSTYHNLGRLLGSGGQGEVYLSARRGTDGFTLPVAMKIFAPDRFENVRDYEEAMRRVAGIASKVALIQHDNLLDVQNFVERDRVRIMVMEWIDGFDLRHLVDAGLLDRLRESVEPRRWRYINEVIITAGPEQNRFKAGVAVAIVRECLSALAALHRDGIIHGDVKPSNIMMKRTGHSKLIDMGSAVEFRTPPRERSCTPAYAAPEILENHAATPRSDLASLGYVLIELLSGRSPFPAGATVRELLEAKRELPNRLYEILPEDVTRNGLLMNFCRGLVAPDANRRFPSAEAAEHVDQGAAAFHRQLVISNMATEYDNDVRLWLQEVSAVSNEEV